MQVDFSSNVTALTIYTFKIQSYVLSLSSKILFVVLAVLGSTKYPGTAAGSYGSYF